MKIFKQIMGMWYVQFYNGISNKMTRKQRRGGNEGTWCINMFQLSKLVFNFPVSSKGSAAPKYGWDNKSKVGGRRGWHVEFYVANVWISHGDPSRYRKRVFSEPPYHCNFTPFVRRSRWRDHLCTNRMMIKFPGRTDRITNPHRKSCLIPTPPPTLQGRNKLVWQL